MSTHNTQHASLKAKPNSYWFAWIGAGALPLLASLALLYYGELTWAAVFLAVAMVTAFAFFSVTKRLKRDGGLSD